LAGAQEVAQADNATVTSAQEVAQADGGKLAGRRASSGAHTVSVGLAPPLGMEIGGTARTGVYLTAIKPGGAVAKAWDVKVGMRVVSIGKTTATAKGEFKVERMVRSAIERQFRSGKTSQMVLVADQPGYAAFELTLRRVGAALDSYLTTADPSALGTDKVGDLDLVI
jgi:hypothetical protein